MLWVHNVRPYGYTSADEFTMVRLHFIFHPPFSIFNSKTQRDRHTSVPLGFCLLFRSKYAVNRACELLEDIHDTRENAFVGSILIRGDSIIVIVGRNLLRAQDEL